MIRIAAILLAATFATANAQSVFSMRRAPGFSLPDTKFKQHDLTDYRGKVVVLEVMKTDCPGCQTLAKSLEQIKGKYGANLQVLSLVTLPDNTSTVTKFIAAHKITSPVLFDCGQVIGSYLQISPNNPKPVHMPHVFVIDKSGMIRQELASEQATGATVAAAIDAALK